MKELPYFKFDCAEWISGEVTLEDLSTQGLFINICAYYWFKSGCLTLTEIKRRVKCKQSNIQSLVDSGLIKIEGENIKVSFLDEQFEERGHKSKINSTNGSLGGAPKGNKNAQKNNQPVDLKQPKTTNIEENKKRIRTEENKSIEHTKNFDWFKSQIDEIWSDQLPSDKKKNLARAIEESWMHISADKFQLLTIDGAGCKRLVNSWLAKMKPEVNKNSLSNRLDLSKI